MGLGTIATQAANSVSITGGSITNITDLAVADGGTGQSTWTNYALPYISGGGAFTELGIGSSTYVLAVNASEDGYEWVEASTTGVTLTQEQIEDYVGNMATSNTETLITVTYEDSDGTLDFVVNNDLNNYSWTNIGTTHLTAARGGTGWDSSLVSRGVPLIYSTGQWGSSSTLPISLGGTAATNTADARTNLGLAIGSNVQGYDAELAQIAALTPTLNGFMAGNGSAWITSTTLNII